MQTQVPWPQVSSSAFTSTFTPFGSFIPTILANLSKLSCSCLLNARSASSKEMVEDSGPFITSGGEDLCSLSIIVSSNDLISPSVGSTTVSSGLLTTKSGLPTS
uniref:Uncharacterized protein n=1 Tax=Opuntia streptacantha TaxID=393608 RepID=A0A7C8ZL94_OPUST